jgi:hypothetical protein
MNMKISDAIYSSKLKNKDLKISEIYIRGNNINSVIMKEGLYEKIEEQTEMESLHKNIPRKKNKKIFIF